VAPQPQVAVVVEELALGVRVELRGEARLEPSPGLRAVRFPPRLDLGHTDAIAGEQVGHVEVVPPRIAGEVDRVERIPAQISPQSAAAEEQLPGLLARLEHLAVLGFDPNGAVVEDAALALARERARGADRVANRDLDPPVAEAVARDSGTDQQAARAHPAADSPRARPALATAVGLEHLLEEGHWTAISQE
jgi:hypothetical protein